MKIKQLLLSCLVIILFIGCRQEFMNVEDEILREKSRFITIRKDFNEIKRFPLFENRVKALNEQSLINKSRKDRDKEIYPRSVLYIEDKKTDRYSYTINLGKDESGNLRNLVLAYDSGRYSIYEINYKISEWDIDKKGVNLLDKTSIRKTDVGEIKETSESCYEMVEYQKDCSCHTTHHSGGCTHPETVYEWREVSCGNGGGGGYGRVINDNDDIWGGYGGGVGGGSNKGGNPPAGVTFLTTPEGEKEEEPCVIVSQENHKLKRIWNSDNIRAAVSSISGTIATDSVEKGFAFGVRGNKYVAGKQLKGKYNSINIPIYNAGLEETIGGVHTHNGTDVFESFSVTDFYGFHSSYSGNPSYVNNFVIGINNTYALIITDEEKFKTFTTRYPRSEYYDRIKGWKDGTEISDDFYVVFRYMEKIGTLDEAFELANAFVLKKYNTGIAISKKDKKGDFKTIFVEEKINKRGEKEYKQVINCNL